MIIRWSPNYFNVLMNVNVFYKINTSNKNSTREYFTYFKRNYF